MSFFYLSPARGDMPVYLLDEIIVQRCHYLQSVLKGEPCYSEYVIDGSVYDNVGHFMLCVVSTLSPNIGFSQFFLKAEVQVFRNRLHSLSAYDLRCFAKKILRSLKKESSLPFSLEPLHILCQHMMLKDMAQHLCSQTHNKNCNLHTIQVYFKHCLSLLANREVEIKKGVVSLHCGKWKDFLITLFRTNLKNRIGKTDLTPLLSDPRISELISKINNEILPINGSSEKNILLSKYVDKTSVLFPPCMLNLHRYLRQKHRLSHYQRFYYSLFLKDIGMPVEEAVNFWRDEYSQLPNGSHSCSHNWQKDEKKYLYGIRHMYGLEGGRKKYTSVSCHQIQSLDRSCSEGGCPFKSFDDVNLTQVLNISADDSRMKQMFEYKSKGQYISACKYFLKSVSSNFCDKPSFNYTPVNYYIEASRQNKL